MQCRAVQNEASTGYDKQNKLCGIYGIETNFKADWLMIHLPDQTSGIPGYLIGKKLYEEIEEIYFGK